MKHKFLITLFFAAQCSISQNLVPNGSFEDYWQCPTNNGLLGVSNWYRPNSHPGTVDYMNTCASLIFFTVPNSILGNQIPHSGNAYIGGFYYNPNFGEVREYIQIQLSSSLTAGQNYHVSFFMSLTEVSHYSINNIGAALTTSAVSGNNNTQHLQLTPQINSTAIISDKNNWTEISGNFQAAGGEQYLTIGNFYSDLQTAVSEDNTGNGMYAYYFLDDVSVTATDLGIEENIKSAINVYPNPVKDVLNIDSGNHTIDKIEIYAFGRLLKETQGNTIDLDELQSGLYLAIITLNHGKKVYKKIIKK